MHEQQRNKKIIRTPKQKNIEKNKIEVSGKGRVTRKKKRHGVTPPPKWREKRNHRGKKKILPKMKERKGELSSKK